MKYLKPYNESIKDFLKPKSEEEINKSLENLSPIDRIKKGVQYNILPMVKNGLENLPNHSYSFKRILADSVYHGYLDIVKYLLDNAKITTFDIDFAIDDLIYLNTPSSLKVKNEMRKLLYDKKLEILYTVKDYNKLLIHGCKIADFDAVKYALDNGATVLDTKYPSDTNYQQIILNAVESEHLEIVKLLIDKGINLNTPNHRPTPIEKAIENNNVDMTKLLMDNGVKVPYRAIDNKMGKWNFEGSHKEIINYLQSLKTSFNNYKE